VYYRGGEASNSRGRRQKKGKSRGDRKKEKKEKSCKLIVPAFPYKFSSKYGDYYRKSVGHSESRNSRKNVDQRSEKLRFTMGKHTERRLKIWRKSARKGGGRRQNMQEKAGGKRSEALQSARSTSARRGKGQNQSTLQPKKEWEAKKGKKRSYQYYLLCVQGENDQTDLTVSRRRS